jgi:hypothetical protein
LSALLGDASYNLVATGRYISTLPASLAGKIIRRRSRGIAELELSVEEGSTRLLQEVSHLKIKISISLYFSHRRQKEESTSSYYNLSVPSN